MKNTNLLSAIFIFSCLCMFFVAIIFILGDAAIDNFPRFLVLKLLGFALIVAAYKGLKVAGFIQWLSRL